MFVIHVRLWQTTYITALDDTVLAPFDINVLSTARTARPDILSDKVLYPLYSATLVNLFTLSDSFLFGAYLCCMHHEIPHSST
jgi:hypothetical protein